MTNGIPETAGALELVPGAQWDGVIREPFPWGFIMMVLCALAVIALVFWLVRGLRRRKSGMSAESCRQWATLVSIALLSVAGGTSLIQISSTLSFSCSGQISDDRTCFILAAYQIAQWLNLLAIALMISGFGFAVSVMLRESGRMETESPTTPPTLRR